MILALALVAMMPVALANASEQNSLWHFEDLTAPCSGNCTISIFSGIYSKTGLGKTVGSPQQLLNSSWGGGGIGGAMFSRKLIGMGDYFQIEGELGTALRFGNQHSPEVWAAFYARWLKFPWDHYVDTTFAVSTGLNYSFINDSVETARFGNGGKPTKLLHYFSPEVTMALPSNPNRIYFFRFHHRSGGAHVMPGIGKALFNDAAAGSDYATVGLRWKF